MRSMMPEQACRSSMVSNSGTMLMAQRPEGWSSPTSFKSSATSSMSDMPLHIEMMHWGITSGPNLACASAAAWNTASSPAVSSLYLTKFEVSGRALRSSFDNSATRDSSLSARYDMPGMAASSSSATVRS